MGPKEGMAQAAHPAGHAEPVSHALTLGPGSIPSQADFSLLTTKTPFRPERLESQMPLDEVYPTHVPARLTRGAAQDRHCEGEGPVHVEHAGEQLTVSCVTYDACIDVPLAGAGVGIPVLPSLTGL